MSKKDDAIKALKKKLKKLKAEIDTLKSGADGKVKDEKAKAGKGKSAKNKAVKAKTKKKSKSKSKNQGRGEKATPRATRRSR